MLYLLPAAVFGHIWMVLFFYSKQTGVRVPFLYYLGLLVLAAFVLLQTTAELRRQNRPSKEL